jgi:ribonuclease P protein component
MRIFGHACFAKSTVVQGKRLPPHDSPQLWKGVCAAGAAVPLCTAFASFCGCGQPGSKDCVYTHLPRASSPTFHSFEGNETDLSAKRAQAEAQARFSCADGDACRPPDSQAPPHEGPQAPFGVAVQKKNRLSRSRDFDAVYRQGRSSSTRFLVLHWFERAVDAAPAEPRLGLAVPKAAGNAVVRNRIKRQLREIWRTKLDAGALPSANDYVLVVRPGLPEAVEANGHAWLVERVDEVLGKAAA